MGDDAGMFGFIDRIYFKRTEKGWLFKEPTFWRRRIYLLTDAEKIRLAKPVRWMSVVSLILIMVAVQAQDFISQRLSVSHGIGVVVVIAGAVTVVWLYVNVVFRPHLAGLTPTAERITASDQFRMQATGLPLPLMIAWLAIGLAFVVVGIGLLFHDKWNWQDAAGIAFFAAIAAYPAALLVLRARQK